MGDVVENTYSCPHCGKEFPPSWGQQETRPPCPDCGGLGITVSVGIASEVNIASEMTVGIGLPDIDRDWRQRWNEIQNALAEIDCEYDLPPTGDAIKTANQKLFSFYVQAYHLKDVLIKDQGSGLSKDDVENAINATPALTLLADLANLDKHYELDVIKHPPRSGDAPVPTGVRGEYPGSGGSWRLRTDIKHLGATRDGMEVAREGVDAWDQLLKGWGLI